MGLLGRLTLGAIELLPEKEISRLVRRGADLPLPLVIRRFAAAYGVNLEEAEKPVEEYRSLLDFFTRRLKPGARPIDPRPEVLACPVDGLLDVVGTITQDRLVQAKGRDYSLAALIGDSDRARRYEGGTFFTLYLSPKDYHRVHCPAAAMVNGYTYVPGSLFPVNANAVQHVDGLFAQNERLITHLESEVFGSIEYVMVGATCVGHIKVAYDRAVATNVGGKELERRTYQPPIPLDRGGELGVFELGSTVVLLTQPGLTPLLSPGTPVQVGMALAKRT
ncbi:MAG: archaetidylserine decarboxylase [Myxococcota bacterium]